MLLLLLAVGAFVMLKGNGTSSPPLAALPWLAQMRAAVADALPQLSGLPAAMVVAHAAYESGFGGGTAARLGNNPFNITAGSTWAGPIVLGGDKDGAGKPITQRFRSYGSLEEAVIDYWRLLGWSRYAPARAALERGDVAGFVSKLKAGGYFELNETSYSRGFAAALAKVQA